jgi:aryl carrier-like protein
VTSLPRVPLTLHIAPLSQKAGKLISRHTRIISNLGATETACLQRLAPSIDDWAYFYWHPTHSGIEMREAMDGLYELFLVRDPKLALYQGVFNTFPNIQEWSMNDLYSRHPDPAKSFLYTYKGRKDDVIVLSNGEKVAPALMEATLMSDPLVRGAMVVGRGKFQPAALIDLAVEPPKDARQRHQMVERLLPVISEANEHASAHGKLDPYHILFASPEKPIYYLGQGKIQRYRTYNLHEDAIEELYRSADDASEQFGFSNLPRLDFTSEGSVTQWLKQLIAEIADVRGLDMDQDLFEAGIDSLQVIRMARELRFQAKRAGLGKAGAEEFLPTTIYSHPTLDQLAAFILREADVKPLINGHIDGRVNGHVKNHADSQVHTHVNGHVNNHVNGHADNHDNGHVHNHVNGHVKGHTRNSASKKMQALLYAFADSLPHSSQLSPPPSTKNMTVVLTGSTGSVGSYLLDALYHNQNVSHIICLNRSSNAAEKHNQTGPRRGLSSLNRNRVEFIKADLSEPQLGLEASVYECMLQNVTHVIREFQGHPP